MDDLSGCKVIHIDSRRRIALQCVDLLLWDATPRQRKKDRQPDTCHVRREAARAFEEEAQAPDGRVSLSYRTLRTT